MRYGQKMDSIFQIIKYPVLWLFAAFYPMLISIYVFLPLFIGLMGYIMIEGIAKERWSYVLLALIYFVSLEINLSLPIFLTVVATLFVYLFFYYNLSYFRHCVVCTPLITAFLIDIVYLGVILGYDFVFQTESIILDKILLYSLVVDMLAVVIFI